MFLSASGLNLGKIMQIQASNSQSFTGVLPIRFRLEERFIHNRGFVKSSGDEIVRILKDAVKNPEKAEELAIDLAKIDPDFDYFALHKRYKAGHIGLPGTVKFITNRNKTYILTGKDAEKLECAGKKIAICNHDIKHNGKTIASVHKLNNARKNYGSTIIDILTDDLARVTSGFNELKQRIGARVGLLCDMNIVKKGNNLKLKLEDSIFSSIIS